MATSSSSSSSSSDQSQSPLLSQHRHAKSRSSVAADNAESLEFLLCAGLTLALLLLGIAGIVYGLQVRAPSPYSPEAGVVSAFVSVINNSGPTGGDHLLTANWAVTLRLDNSHSDTVHPYRVEASVFDQDSVAGQRPLASTRRFSGVSSFNPTREDGLTFSIQLRAENADVRERVSAAISRDLKMGNRLRFVTLVLVWVRISSSDISDRFHVAVISCDPLWVGPSSIVGREYGDKKKCEVQGILQSKLSSSDEESWTTLNMTKLISTM